MHSTSNCRCRCRQPLSAKKAVKLAGLTVLLLVVHCKPLAIADDTHALHSHYLANAGVMVAKGETRLLFDPFFRNDYGVYQLVPADIEAAIMAGMPPYDGVDAVFVSHYHDDHFDPALVVAYLLKWPGVQLYAPQQAVDVMLQAVEMPGRDVLDRIHGLELFAGGETIEIHADEIEIEAVAIAHAGWPSRNTDIDNVAYRVTLDASTSVVHLGDADKNREHYEPHRDFWHARTARLAFAPVWLLLTEPGRQVLDEYVRAQQVIGVHVYDQVPRDPADRPEEFDGLDIFVTPGEFRNHDSAAPADSQSLLTD